MKKVFESDPNGFSESGSVIHVYEFADEDEKAFVLNLSHDEKCFLVGVRDEAGYYIAPGAKYHTYEFSSSDGHLVMTETIAYNV